MELVEKKIESNPMDCGVRLFSWQCNLKLKSQWHTQWKLAPCRDVEI